MPEPSGPLQLDRAQVLVASFLTDSPQGAQFAQLPPGDVAQVLVLFDRLERDPALKEGLASLSNSQQLVDLANEAGAAISLAAADVMVSGVELLDDDQLDQVTGGSLLGLAGLAAVSVSVLAVAAKAWMVGKLVAYSDARTDAKNNL